LQKAIAKISNLELLHMLARQSFRSVKESKQSSVLLQRKLVLAFWALGHLAMYGRGTARAGESSAVVYVK